jgi:hypothetical protein
MYKQAILTVFAPMVAGLLLSACQSTCQGTGGTKGSGNVQSQTRAVGSFTAVEMKGTGRLDIKPGPAEALTISAEDNLLPLLTSDVNTGRLVLGFKEGSSVDPTKDIVYTLTIKSLTELQLSGTCTVNASDLSGPSLKVSASGVSGITLAGKVDHQEVSLTGAGKYNAENMDSKTAVIHSSGAGTAVVKVSDDLNVKLSGVGSVEYIGDPKVTQNISGAGSIKKR